MSLPKLVRDRIPAIITQSGSACRTTVLDEQEYHSALLAKLVEEAQEVQTADADTMLCELADVLEVFEAVLALHHIAWDDVRERQQTRQHERGGFAERVQLDWVEE